MVEDGKVVDRVTERARVERDRERHQGQTGEEQLGAARTPAARPAAARSAAERRRTGALGEVDRPPPRIPQYFGKNSAKIEPRGSGGCERELVMA